MKTTLCFVLAALCLTGRSGVFEKPAPYGENARASESDASLRKPGGPAKGFEDEGEPPVSEPTPGHQDAPTDFDIKASRSKETAEAVETGNFDEFSNVEFDIVKAAEEAGNAPLKKDGEPVNEFEDNDKSSSSEPAPNNKDISAAVDFKELDGLPSTKKGWYFNRNKTNDPPSAQTEIDLREYDAYYLGDANKKEVYLTFDEGYENGYTSAILDVLKEKKVPAAFFVTKSYIKENVELIKRMKNEGHIAGNHSVSHKSFPTLSPENIVSELERTAKAYKEATGEDMPPFFRPPMGEYSVKSLAATKAAGYKTIFWSYAYQDWLVNQQPGKEKALKVFKDNLHNGGVILLHAVSKSNAEALSEMIDYAHELGYKFKGLDALD
ncbi:MAG: polysaccharide deacetylase family protein [Clostridiales bacterium]|nr:polysaccharide deacetylase family protein [Clostridiales bacterium]